MAQNSDHAKLTSAANDVTGELLPRLSTSRQWTPLPQEFIAKVRTVFTDQFPMEAQDGTFVIEGRIYPDEIVLRAGYLEEGRLRQVNFEASVDLPKKKKAIEDVEATQSATMDKLYVALDALGSVMEEYFDLGDDEDGESLDIPPHWRAYEFEGETVYLQFSTVNSALEAEANRLLGVAFDNLYNETEATEDALGKAEIDSELAMEVSKVLRARAGSQGHSHHHADGLSDVASDLSFDGSAEEPCDHSSDHDA